MSAAADRPSVSAAADRPSVSAPVERPSHQIDIIANCVCETAKTDEGRDGQRM